MSKPCRKETIDSWSSYYYIPIRGIWSRLRVAIRAVCGGEIKLHVPAPKQEVADRFVMIYGIEEGVGAV